MNNNLTQDTINQQKTGVAKNTNPYSSKFQPEQIVNTAQLVELFGSPANKKTYKKNKKISNNTKDSLIKKASQYCIINPLGEGNFKIEKVFDFSLNSKLVKFLNNPIDNLFKSILLKVVTYAILTQKNENNCLSFRLMEYAKNFKLINSNYQLLKYADDNHKQLMLNEIQVSELSLIDFYSSVDHAINSALLDVLNILSDVHAISLTKNMLILIKQDDHGNYYKKRASEKEEGVITKAIDNFVTKYNVQNYNDLFYNKYFKPNFQTHMSSVLKTIGAVNFYRTYEVFITNSVLLNHILDYTDFRQDLLPSYYAILNGLFIDKMTKNAISRNHKRILKFIRNSDALSSFFQDNNIDINDLTLSNYTAIIPKELIDSVVKQLLQNTSKKNEEKDFSKLSTTLVDEQEFKTLCETNIKDKPCFKLFQIAFDNSVEGKPMDINDESINDLVEFKVQKSLNSSE